MPRHLHFQKLPVRDCGAMFRRLLCRRLGVLYEQHTNTLQAFELHASEETKEYLDNENCLSLGPSIILLQAVPCRMVLMELPVSLLWRQNRLPEVRRHSDAP